MELRHLQERFLEYLRTADPGIEQDICGASEKIRNERLSIYFNAYRIRLKGSIQTDHEILAKYLGDEWFDQLAIEYIQAHPSSETNLRYFCERLPQFLGTQKPFSDNPQLADLARWERLLMQAFDAASAPRLDHNYLSSIAPDQWPGLKLNFHPSAHIFETRWNTVDIWRAIKSEQAPPDATRAHEQTWLVWRNAELLTEFRSMPLDECIAFNFAQGGYAFSDVCEELQSGAAIADVASAMLGILQRWIQDGVLINMNSSGSV